MWANVLLYGFLFLMIAPLVINGYFGYVEAQKEKNPVKQVESSRLEFIDGTVIYQTRCASCHGANGDGAGGYPRVNGEKKHQIMRKMMGYQQGTYGGSSKGVMKLQITDLSRLQIENVSEYLSNLTPVLSKKELDSIDIIELDDYDSSS
jgi:cytochrome c